MESSEQLWKKIEGHVTRGWSRAELRKISEAWRTLLSVENEISGELQQEAAKLGGYQGSSMIPFTCVTPEQLQRLTAQRDALNTALNMTKVEEDLKYWLRNQRKRLRQQELLLHIRRKPKSLIQEHIIRNFRWDQKAQEGMRSLKPNFKLLSAWNRTEGRPYYFYKAWGNTTVTPLTDPKIIVPCLYTYADPRSHERQRQINQWLEALWLEMIDGQ